MKGGLTLVLTLLALSPGGAEARADEWVFDLHFWSHPRYIDPTYDFEAPQKSEEATAAKTGEDPERSKPGERRAPGGSSGRGR